MHIFTENTYTIILIEDNSCSNNNRRKYTDKEVELKKSITKTGNFQFCSYY